MKTYTISINGQAAVDAGYKYIGNRCYSHIMGGQIEVVIDEPGTYNDRPNKWVEVAYIATIDEARAIVAELAKIGMGGCYYVIASEDDDSPNGPEETDIEDGTIPQADDSDSNSDRNTDSKHTLYEAVKKAILDMGDVDAISLWNEYCGASRRYDDRIENMDSLPEIFDTSSADGLFTMLNRFYFGHDENDTNSSANPNRDYFCFNGYGNIVSTDYPKDIIEEDELAEWIVENGDALYNDEIQEILDSADDDETNEDE